MSQTLYRKYRPQDFGTVIGQEHVVTTLINAISANRVSHAYLFTGPRGTGKTTIARLLATAVNCQKRKDFTPADATVCEAFHSGAAVDLIEIDAASHTGVDNIRALRETIALAPTAAPFKVYIIDEVHMLSTGAFNALLKTLEEPPAHAIFILATTEIHKVPETIISRCQRFDFARLSVAAITQKLAHIATEEKVKVESDALEMVAIAANGGMRDAESLLAQVFAFSDKHVTTDDVARILGVTTHEQIFATVTAFVERDIDAALRAMNGVVHAGYNLETFASALIITLRALLFLTVTTAKETRELVTLTKREYDALSILAQKTDTARVLQMIAACEEAKTQISSSVVPQLPLEIAAVKICGSKGDAPEHSQDVSTRESQEQKSPQKTSTKNTTKKSVKSVAQETTSTSRGDNAAVLAKVQKKWPLVVEAVKEQNMSLSSLLTQAMPVKIEDGRVILAVRYSLHAEKIQEQRNKLTIVDALATIVALSLRVDAEVVSEELFHEASPSELLSRASQMMGGHIVEH